MNDCSFEDTKSDDEASPSAGRSPIWRLPDDVLAEIFVHHALHAAQNTPQKYWMWNAITHVCRGWSAVAIGTPKMWAFLSAAWPLGVVQLFIERSGVLPLNVLYFQPFSGESYKLILSHLPRLLNIEFRVLGKASDLAESVRRHTAAPHLKELALSFYSLANNASFPVLCTLSMPRLAALSVTFSSFQCVQTLIHPKLISLYIRSPREKERITLPLLLDTLSTLRSLQTLSLLHVYEPTHDATTSAPTLHLPHLSYLNIAGTAIGTIHLLAHLTFPPSTRCNVVRWPRSHDAVADERLASAIRTQVLVLADMPAFRSISIDLKDSRRRREFEEVNLTFQIWSTFQSLENLISSDNETDPEESNAKLVLKLETDESLMPVILAELTTKAELSAVTTMCITCSHRFLADSDWRSLLQAVPNVVELALGQVALISFLDAVESSACQYLSMGGTSSPLCPSLEVLRLVHVTFADCPTHNEHGLVRRQVVVDLITTLTRGDRPILKSLQIQHPVNFTVRDHEALLHAPVAQVVDVLDWGMMTYRDCTEDERHCWEPSRQYEFRMWRRDYYTDCARHLQSTRGR